MGFADTETLTRSVISPFELGVWVPSSKLAIECSDLCWHNKKNDNVFDTHHHRQKYDACSKEGIRLLQFFSDEWIEKNEICRSITDNALGLTATKLNARDCEFVVLDPKTSRQFLEENHIGGATPAKRHTGLVHPKHGLVSIMTLRTPIQKKWGHVTELARSCSRLHFSVRGGTSRLTHHARSWAHGCGYDGILSYADLRFGDGKVYEKCGFTYMTDNKTNYWYTNGVKRFNRFVYRARDGMSEREVAEINQVRPIYGCGNAIYLMKF